jgi:exodeoxyribonuclease-3
MPLRVATWNVNSVRLRLPGLARLAAEHAPDVLCLQEIKVADELFPRDFLAGLGYPHQAVYGQKSYHGVAILSRLPFESARRRAWWGKAEARHLHVRLGSLLLHNFYVPAGGDVPDPDENPKFAHKLGFIDEVAAWFRTRPQPARQFSRTSSASSTRSRHGSAPARSRPANCCSATSTSPRSRPTCGRTSSCSRW